MFSLIESAAGTLGKPGIVMIAPQITTNEIIQFGSRTTSSSISGITSEFLVVRSFEIAKGRFINDKDTKGAKNVVVIGPDLEEKLFNERQGLNQKIPILFVSVCEQNMLPRHKLN